MRGKGLKFSPAFGDLLCRAVLMAFAWRDLGGGVPTAEY